MAAENIQIVVTTGAREGKTVLRLKGPLSIHTVFDFQTAIRSETSPMVIVDFSGVPFMDSSGLGALVGARIAMDKLNRKLALTGMNAQIKALMDMTHVGKFFNSYPTVEDAEAAWVQAAFA